MEMRRGGDGTEPAAAGTRDEWDETREEETGAAEDPTPAAPRTAAAGPSPRRTSEKNACYAAATAALATTPTARWPGGTALGRDGRRRRRDLKKKLKSKRKNKKDPCDDGLHFTCRSTSLGTGRFSATGVSSLTISNKGSYGSISEKDEHDSAATKLSPVVESLRPSRVFIRTADLHMKSASLPELAEHEQVEYVHRPSPNPPLPFMNHDPNESWVALDDGNGGKAPLADATIAALVNTALEASLNKGMWTANAGTTKLLKSNLWKETIYVPYTQGIPVPHARGSKGERDVMVWSGEWGHAYHGHDLPAVRCEAIINMSPKALANLLIDSTKVEKYNKMSIGREDVMVLHEGQHCSTKIVVGKARPPMLNKTLVLTNLLHMEELPGGGTRAGYVIVSRAVVHADGAEADSKLIQSEMLMGLNVLRVVDGEPDRCVMINLNHLSSPMIPAMFAKRLGLAAAVNFINDIRALCGLCQ